MIRTLLRLLLALWGLPYSIFGFTPALLRSVRTLLRGFGEEVFFLILFFENSFEESLHALLLLGCYGVGFERFEEPSGFFIVAVGDQHLDSFQRFFELPAITLGAHSFFGAFHP
ncbi:MAG: hypothetical protein HXL29_08710, partial [Prevotellaceae bacterium]|nr:hypothetical protein [Prevotellaceae bacterium]